MMQVQRKRGMCLTSIMQDWLFENKHNLGFTELATEEQNKQMASFYVSLIDAVVTDYWADRCVNVTEVKEHIGIVGSRLIYEDGILQESGGGYLSRGACRKYW